MAIEPVTQTLRISPITAMRSTRSHCPAPTFWPAIEETEAPIAMPGIWM